MADYKPGDVWIPSSREEAIRDVYHSLARRGMPGVNEHPSYRPIVDDRASRATLELLGVTADELQEALDNEPPIAFG